MGRNRFTDPATAASYDWLINHDEEEQIGRDRGITYEANTGNVGLVVQQGELTPIVLKLSGKILEQSQLDQFIDWFDLCQHHSIYFTDFAGDSYEVIISVFTPKRLRTLRNPRGGTINPRHYWSYTMEMSVLSVRAGVWAGSPA